MKKRGAKDAVGRTIRRGDTVRVIGVPDLNGMSSAAIRQSRPVFRHILGTYRKIDGFGQNGFAEIVFKIRKGPYTGWHAVGIESHLLKLKQARRKNPIKKPRDGRNELR